MAQDENVVRGQMLEPNTEHVEQFVQQRFPGAMLMESHHVSRVEYRIHRQSMYRVHDFVRIETGESCLIVEAAGVKMTAYWWRLGRHVLGCIPS